MKIAIRVFVALGALVGAAIVVLLWVMFADHGGFKGGLADYDDLPESAGDIMVYRNRNISGAQFMEFRIPEEDFRAYVEGQGWKLAELSEPTHVLSTRLYQEQGRPAYTAVSRGLVHEARRANGGGITVVFDRDRGVAYVNRSSR